MVYNNQRFNHRQAKAARLFAIAKIVTLLTVRYIYLLDSIYFKPYIPI